MIEPDNSHYRHGTIEPWEYIAAHNFNFFEGSAIKYITRWRHKDGLKDLKKARVYVNELIRQADPGAPNTDLPAAVITSINALRCRAAQQYGPLLTSYEGLGALQLEFDEVKSAMQAKDTQQLRMELLDLVNVATRWIDALDREAAKP